MNDDVDNVVHVTFSTKQPGWKPKVPQRGFCSCYDHMLVDDHTRTVECSKCGKLLEPFEVLNRFAQGVQRWIDWEKHYKGKAMKAAAEVESIKRELQSLKQKVSRVARADAELAVAAEQRRLASTINDVYADLREMAELVAKSQRRLERNAKRVGGERK